MALGSVDQRKKVLAVAHELLAERAQCHYSENVDPSSPEYRWGWRDHLELTFPFYSDCSGTFEAIDFFAGCLDPSNDDYRPADTATMLAHAQKAKLIRPQRLCLPGDGCFFGWDHSIEGPEHVAMLLQFGWRKDPLFFNMGGPSDPSIQPLSNLVTIGQPVTFFRNVTHRNNVRPRP